MKDNNIVRKTIDPAKPPTPTAKQKARLEALAALPDERINLNDAPARPNAEWVKAAGRLPGTKQQITLRIDADVLAFFKETGARYQSRINSVLRAYVEASKAHVKERAPR